MPSGTAAAQRVDPTAAVRRSALWAAWGDAVGFPAELARDQGELQRRFGSSRIDTTKRWRRRIGGRMGVEVELPAGMYSDDTQLRLAVGRCVRAAARFDAEVFSKIELPVFLSYGFGVGRGTRAAAQSLTKRTVRWYNNFFSAKAATYVQGGGNGAAMRIQPHVWAAPRFSADAFLPNVIRDSVCTHGHVRGLLGSALHAVSLGVTLREGTAPDPSRWVGMLEYLERLPDMVEADEVLGDRWLPLWEEKSERTFRTEVNRGLEETLRLVKAAQEAARAEGGLEVRYADLTRTVGGLDSSTRGSGTVSAVLALWLAHCGGSDPASAITCAANLLGSDTDTIASMAGAIVGVGASENLPGQLVDEALIAEEAERLALLGSGTVAPSFAHPDPLRWQAPRTQADALGLLEGQLVLAGLGPARAQREPIAAPDGGLWQWIELEFGQTALVKRREMLPRLTGSAAPQLRLVPAEARPTEKIPMQQQLPTDEVPPATSAPKRAAGVRAKPPTYPDDVVDGVSLLVKQRFDMVLMSRLLMHYARQEHGVTKAAFFGSLVAEALQAHDRRSKAKRSS